MRLLSCVPLFLSLRTAALSPRSIVSPSILKNKRRTGRSSKFPCLRAVSRTQQQTGDAKPTPVDEEHGYNGNSYCVVSKSESVETDMPVDEERGNCGNSYCVVA
ncbi:hypothetical protein PLICRDRAFT_362560 [Plicaturopsis crispa FD-325 SS-3]|uniref:Pheromone n=1 Tax=Plicaturopsis crispa FD-325 SS-3 TaxID=944288 RepID=A0A0C9SR53_PLICR|nr:hypothetical protein PLICRDRAFT_362560 [Plicaturopsis crispa FD-325 SS-3]